MIWPFHVFDSITDTLQSTVRNHNKCDLYQTWRRKGKRSHEEEEGKQEVIFTDNAQAICRLMTSQSDLWLTNQQKGAFHSRPHVDRTFKLGLF